MFDAVDDGKLDGRATRKEAVTEEELPTTMRSEELEEFDQIKRTSSRGDGSINTVSAE